MKKYNPSGNVADVNNVSGYSDAQTMVAVLKACGDNLTRENVMKQAASIHNLTLPMLLPGITISTSADRFCSDQADADGQVRRHHLAAVWRGDLGGCQVATAACTAQPGARVSPHEAGVRITSASDAAAATVPMFETVARESVPVLPFHPMAVMSTSRPLRTWV